MTKRRFDSASGQVFTDRVIPSFVYRSDATGPSWTHESPYLPPGWEEGSLHGANSLKHMAMRKTLMDQRPLTAGHFVHFPWELTQYLWDCLGRWEIAPYHSFKSSIKKMPVRDYVQLIRSPSFSWGTVLALSTDHVDLHGLVEISKVNNLVALDVAAPYPTKSSTNEEDGIPITMLTDRVVRSWGELALSNAAFKNLRILMLHIQTEISLRIFSYLDHFPSLEVFIVVGSPQLTDESAKDVAEKHGWTTRRVNATNRSIYECFDKYNTSKSPADKSMLPEIGSLPLLDFSLGVPEAKAYKQKHTSVWFQRPIRKNASIEHASKKRPVQPEIAKTVADVKRQRSKVVPKGQRNMNMAGLLAEFQRFIFLIYPPQKCSPLVLTQR
ncbi:hypothetical protein AJ79_03269 [Helicocarpus griseus UAMH5409]|uniref:Uncharacterized protein n=1 Tax=Helicocarpus griseus UAMH5409 TaxID=1447875 RepID=A0A2B7XY95_9EURO|nr:hypothetical protein AJ79_03269 [Helicocarpus griseus UAMH5409]